jgi:hypothetical protein
MNFFKIPGYERYYSQSILGAADNFNVSSSEKGFYVGERLERVAK